MTKKRWKMTSDPAPDSAVNGSRIWQAVEPDREQAKMQSLLCYLITMTMTLPPPTTATRKGSFDAAPLSAARCPVVHSCLAC